MSPSLLWAYCIARPEAARAACAEPGLEGTPPISVEVGPLAAVAGRVPRDAYDEAALPLRIRDLDWVGDRGLAHDRVVDRCFNAGPTVPLRFGTLFASEERLSALLEREAPRLEALLARLAGKAEWALSIHADAKVVEERARARAANPAAAGAAGRGRAYLEAKRAAVRARDAAREMLPALVDAVHALHAERAAAAVIQPLPEGQALLHQAAFLVDREATAAFLAASDAEAERVAPEGLRLRLTGPWPPYSFVGAIEEGQP